MCEQRGKKGGSDEREVKREGREEKMEMDVYIFGLYAIDVAIISANLRNADVGRIGAKEGDFFSLHVLLAGRN